MKKQKASFEESAVELFSQMDTEARLLALEVYRKPDRRRDLHVKAKELLSQLEQLVSDHPHLQSAASEAILDAGYALRESRATSMRLGRVISRERKRSPATADAD